MNPILKREFFVRWRDWRSHLLLLVLAVLLCVTASWSYDSAIHDSHLNNGVYASRPVIESIATRASRTGRTLFSTLAVGNVIVWFIMAPLLTATGVARERERGLLESLQLSHMTARSQVFSRALSALLYLFALQLMTLPVYFVAFSFGGVSQNEIARAWLVVAATAWCGIGLGLMLSASASRPSGALFSAVGLLCAWSLAAYLGWSDCLSPLGLLGLGSWTLPLAQMMYWSHPFVVVANLCDLAFIHPVRGMFGGGLSLWPLDAMFPLCVVSLCAIGYLGLSRATRDVTRAFAPSGWAGRNPLIENWKQQRQKRSAAQRQRANGDLGGALLADLPVDRLVRFKNPLLNREVKSRFRLRRASPFIWLGRAGVFVFAVGGWIMGMALVFDGVGRPSGAPIVMWMEWVLGIALVGTFAASSFAREREAGTWESIRLSLLTNGQLARTKWASPLVAFALLTCPLWVLLLAFAPIGPWSGMPVRVLVAGALFVAASLGLISALAEWISLRARSTTTATCSTLGILLLLCGIAPSMWQTFDMSSWSAKKIAGVAPPTLSPYTGNEDRWREQTPVRERYTLETGSNAPVRTYYSGPYVTATGPATANEVQSYLMWCDAKQKQATRVAALSGAWNPALVLQQISGFTPDAARSDSAVVDANTLVQMCLAHVLLCVLAILLFLGAITRRLRALPE